MKEEFEEFEDFLTGCLTIPLVIVRVALFIAVLIVAWHFICKFW